MQYSVVDDEKWGKRIVGPVIDCDFADQWLDGGFQSNDVLRETIVEQLEKAYKAGHEKGC